MENINRLISWFSSNHSQIGTGYQRVLSTTHWLPGHVDIIAKATIKNRPVIGRSVAPSLEQALLKATMELIERIVYYSSAQTRISGFAAHFSEEASCLSAALELVERDAVLASFLLKRGFQKANADALSFLEEGVEHFKSISYSEGVEWNFFSCESYYKDIHVRICRGRRDERSIFGFGAGFSEEDASRKALYECIQNVPTLCDPSGSFTTLNAFRQKEFWTPADHGFLGLDKDYCLEIEPLFATKIREASPTKGCDFDVSDFEFSQLRLPDEVAALADIVFVSEAKNNRLQDLYVGPSKIENINWSRFPETSIHELNNVPHFIG